MSNIRCQLARLIDPDWSRTNSKSMSNFEQLSWIVSSSRSSASSQYIWRKFVIFFNTANCLLELFEGCRFPTWKFQVTLIQRNINFYLDKSWTPLLSGSGYSSSLTVKVSIAIDEMHGSSLAAFMIFKIDEFSLIESWFGHPFSTKKRIFKRYFIWLVLKFSQKLSVISGVFWLILLWCLFSTADCSRISLKSFSSNLQMPFPYEPHCRSNPRLLDSSNWEVINGIYQR